MLNSGVIFFHFYHIVCLIFVFIICLTYCSIGILSFFFKVYLIIDDQLILIGKIFSSFNLKLISFYIDLAFLCDIFLFNKTFQAVVSYFTPSCCTKVSSYNNIFCSQIFFCLFYNQLIGSIFTNIVLCLI